MVVSCVGNKQGIYRLPQIFEHDQEIGDGKYNQLSENSSSDSTSQSDTSSELSSELSSGQSTPYLTPNSSYSDLSLVKHTMKKSSSLAFIMQNVNAQKQDTDSIKIGEEVRIFWQSSLGQFCYLSILIIFR